MIENHYLQYVSNHIIVTTRLLKTFKFYIEAKNHGIHGGFIASINDVLNKLQWELDDLYKIQKYLKKDVDKFSVCIAIVKTVKPIPVILNFKAVSDELLSELKSDLLDAFQLYCVFEQSKNIETVKHVLEKLEK
jgi:hypothetical protein